MTENIDGNPRYFIRHKDAMINELGIGLRKLIFNHPGPKMQYLRTLQRIFDVNETISNEVEAEQLIQKELLKSNQEKLNEIQKNLITEMKRYNISNNNIEGFSNKKPIQRIQSNYTNENLTVLPNTDNTVIVKS